MDMFPHVLCFKACSALNVASSVVAMATRQVIPYWFAQLLGAFLSAAMIYWVYYGECALGAVCFVQGVSLVERVLLYRFVRSHRCTDGC